jgi:Fe-S-cluster-containing hydrogenase component 2
MRNVNLHYLVPPSEKSAKGSIEEKWDIISQLEKGEWIVDICRNVRLALSSVRTIRDDADRIKESAKSGTKMLV